MKLRIIEVFDASLHPWYRLQRLEKGIWEYINGDTSIEELTKQATRMLNHTDPTQMVVVKEFSSENELLVDNPPLEG